MRKLGIWVVVLVGVGLMSSLPIAMAADFPAFADGGSVLTTVDAGFLVCGTAGQGRFTRGGWDAVVRCRTRNVHYVFCADATCTPGAHNQELTADLTYDIPVPGGLDTLCISTSDAGIPWCTLQYKRDKGQ